MASPGSGSASLTLRVVALVIGLGAPLLAQSGSNNPASELPAQPGWMRYLERRTEQLTERSQRELEKISPDSWPAQSAQWRQELREMLGLSPLPERTDLNAKTFGRVEHEGYCVSRVAFESRPGLIVTANLYEPIAKAPEKGWPTVLYVCGHANVRDEGRLLGNKTGYQHHGIWFARHNVVCLIIDTIQLGELHGEHHGTYKLGRWDWMTRGYTPAGVETWNSIRALDYLETLPIVDKERIGITGRSGGGAYSWFVAALDERVRAAVPVAGITDLRNHVVDGCVEGHCDCMYFINYFGWDYNRLAALVAPRALLLGNSDTDRIFPLDGVMRIHADLVRTYKRLGAADKLGLLMTPGPHQDTQELQVGAFRWLLFHLTGKPAVIDTAATKELEPSELQVFNHETPAEERLSSVSSWFVPTAASVTDPMEAGRAWKNEWAQRLQRLWQASKSADAPGDVTQGYALLADGKTADIGWQWYQGADEFGWTSNVLIIASPKADRSKAAIVHVGPLLGVQLTRSSVEEALERDGRLRAHVDAQPDRRHIVVSPRSEGLFALDRPVREQTQIHRRFYLLGDSAERLAIADIQAQLHWLREQKQMQCDHVELIGHGRWAPVALLVALASADDAEESPDARPQRSLRLVQPVIDRCSVINYPRSLGLSPTLLGLNRITTFDNLLQAASGLLKAESSFALTASSAKIAGASSAEKVDGNRLLVDPSREPQQASGLRIVEVSDAAATIWCRATLWPLPNLADLPAVEFADDPQIKVRERREPILPPEGTAGLRYAAPGVDAEMRVRYRESGKSWRETAWQKVSKATDFSALVPLQKLSPATAYEIQVQARAAGSATIGSTSSGSFKTLPDPKSRASFRLAVGTCQEFEDRDGDYGMDLYRTLLHRNTQAFVLAGDVVYYDKLARSVDLAHYHWQRMYSMPTLVNFHRRVPTYFLKDDHDTYVNDSWPGQSHKWTRDFTFADGQRIFREQAGLPNPPYRTFRVGRELQLWMMEGRDYRDPNNAVDGPMKTIWGADQLDWLRQTLADSDAKFKILISPTPLVGPDRDNKADNHSNKVFATEGKAAREFLSKVPNLVVVCGDRHWQYHSVDPATGLHEFSVGPVSNRHAGGWNANDFRKDIHRFLRVGGGYLEIDLRSEGDSAQLTLTHFDPYGAPQHEHRIE